MGLAEVAAQYGMLRDGDVGVDDGNAHTVFGVGRLVGCARGGGIVAVEIEGQHGRRVRRYECEVAVAIVEVEAVAPTGLGRVAHLPRGYVAPVETDQRVGFGTLRRRADHGEIAATHARQQVRRRVDGVTRQAGQARGNGFDFVGRERGRDTRIAVDIGDAEIRISDGSYGLVRAAGKDFPSDCRRAAIDGDPQVVGIAAWSVGVSAESSGERDRGSGGGADDGRANVDRRAADGAGVGPQTDETDAAGGKTGLCTHTRGTCNRGIGRDGDGERGKFAIPFRRAQRPRLDRSCRRLEIPIAAEGCSACIVGRRRDVGAGRGGKHVDEDLARRAGRHVAAVEQDVAALRHGRADNCEVGRLVGRHGLRGDMGRTERKVAGRAVADDMNRRDIRAPGQRHSDLMQTIGGMIDHDDFGARRRSCGDDGRVGDRAVDEHDHRSGIDPRRHGDGAIGCQRVREPLCLRVRQDRSPVRRRLDAGRDLTFGRGLLQGGDESRVEGDTRLKAAIDGSVGDHEGRGGRCRRHVRDFRVQDAGA